MGTVGNIVASGATTLAVDLLRKMAGPAADQIGLMLGDKAWEYRAKNLIVVTERTQRRLRDAGLPANAVPPRLLLPIVENSSVEDNETLQEMWAGLLATTSQETDSVSPSFIETLKQLTPDEARYLEHMYEMAKKSEQFPPKANNLIYPGAFTEKLDGLTEVSVEVYERLGLIQKKPNVNLEYSQPWSRTPSLREEIKRIRPHIGYLSHWTQYGISFLEACRGPRPSA